MWNLGMNKGRSLGLSNLDHDCVSTGHAPDSHPDFAAHAHMFNSYVEKHTRTGQTRHITVSRTSAVQS
jgi:hypothetical protein